MSDKIRHIARKLAGIRTVREARALSKALQSALDDEEPPAAGKLAKKPDGPSPEPLVAKAEPPT